MHVPGDARIVARSVSNSSSPTDFVAHVPERDLRLAPTRSTTTKSVGALDAAVFARDTTRQATFSSRSPRRARRRRLVRRDGRVRVEPNEKPRVRRLRGKRDGDDARVSLVVSLVARHVVVVAIIVIVIVIIIIIIIFPNDPSRVRLPMPTDRRARPTDGRARPTDRRARASRLARGRRARPSVGRPRRSAWGDRRESL